MKVSLLATVAMAACLIPGPSEAGDCYASGLQSLVGQPATNLALMDLPSPVRIIHPGDIVTFDYRVERLNIHIDENGQISRVVCG